MGVVDRSATAGTANPNVDDVDDARRLVDGILDYGIFMLDPAGQVRTWNAGALRLNGFTADEIIGEQHDVFFSAAARDAGEPVRQLSVARDAGRFEEEAWRQRKDGSRFWASVVVTALHDLDGLLRGFGVVVRDLSERRDAEARYRLLIESVRDYAIITLDPSGVVLSWNMGAETIKGYRADEIVGRNFRSFYTQVDLDRDYPTFELQRAAEDGRYEDEGWRVRKDGSRFWANVVITALREPTGRLVGYSKVTRDLTERRLAEESLRESEERFRLMVASVKDYAIIMLDPSGHIISWNAGAERIKGWTAAEIIGQSFESFYPPEDVAAGKTRFELEGAAESGAFEDNGWRVRKDGSRFWANVVITALRDEKGTLRGYSKVTRDQTERKNADEALHKAYEDLESFSYSVSHDLRAPLRSMDGFSEELLLRYADRLDDRGRGYLGRIRTSAQRMALLIDDLLNLSRLGRARLTRQRVDLSELALQVADELRRAEPHRAVEVVVAAGLVVDADPALLRVVLQNLLSNAWKYTSRHPTARIEVGVEVAGGGPRFFVKDDGAGFDMIYGGKLFGPFQRLHPNGLFEGTGIGLATVKRIVQRHGGVVGAVGAVESGATFTFTIGRSA